MARYSDTVLNTVAGLQVPLPGATVYVYNRDGTLATLTNDDASGLANPVKTDAYGGFYFNAADGLYDLSFHYGGREVWQENAVQVGTGPVLPTEIVTALGGADGASLIGFSHLFPGSKTRTMQDKASYDVPISLDDADETDDYSRAMWAFDAVAASAAPALIFPPRDIVFSQTPEFNFEVLEKTLAIQGFGAVLKTVGAIAALKLTGYQPPYPIVVEGLTVNHRNNGDATAGIVLDHTNFVTLRYITVDAYATNSDWAGIKMTGGDCNWTTIDQCAVRKRASEDVGNPQIGILIEGPHNETLISRYRTSNCVDAILVRPLSPLATGSTSSTNVPNALYIQNSAFEQVDRAIRVSGVAATEVSGLRIMMNRFEAMVDAAIVLEGSQTVSDANAATLLLGNYYTGVDTIIQNDENLPIINLDVLGYTGDLAFLTRGTPIFRNTAGTGYGLDVWAATASAGTIFRDDAGVQLGTINPTSAGNGLDFACTNDGTLEMRTIRGLSRTGTKANNLRGTVTLASGTAAVTFGTAEADTSYFIALSGNANETFRWGSKATGGFTITSSNGSSTAVVDWHLIR